MTRALAAAALAVAALIALAACASDEPTVAVAEFDDVVDLTVNGAVMIADVRVGVIDAIELTDDHRARVTMSVDPEVALPARVQARLRKTNVLGERFVELVPDRDRGGRFDSGSLIHDTVIVPELEELVFSGTDVVAAVAADALAGAIDAGAEGLGGRGSVLNATLDDLTEIVSAYEDNSADLVRLIDGFGGFLADVGPEAALHGQAVGELARFNRVLAEEDDRLLDALGEVRALSATGTDIMTTHRERIDAFFRRFQRISAEIVAREEDLRRLFAEVAMHNNNTIEGVNSEHAQVILDWIVCGVNDEPRDPVRSCEDRAPTGMPRPEPRPPQDY